MSTAGFKQRPILQCVQDHIGPLRESLRWGFDIPYMISGQLNQHPRQAMASTAGKERGQIVKFYDSMFDEE